MARGIISAILGGVAGGLEGRKNMYLREQEEAERQRIREEENAWRQRMFDAQQSQAQFANAMQARSMGGTVGGAPRLTREVAAPPPEREALRSALFEASQEGPEDRFMPREDFSEFRRPRTEFVIDPDYEEMSFGDQTFAFRTPEAMERMAREREEAEAAARRAEIEEGRAFQIELEGLKHDFNLDRDGAKYAADAALARLRSSLRVTESLGGGQGAGLDQITNARLQEIVVGVIKDGKPVFDEDTGRQTGSIPYTTEEIEEMYKRFQDGLGLSEGAAQGRAMPVETAFRDFVNPRLSVPPRRPPSEQEVSSLLSAVRGIRQPSPPSPPAPMRTQSATSTPTRRSVTITNERLANPELLDMLGYGLPYNQFPRRSAVADSLASVRPQR